MAALSFVFIVLVIFLNCLQFVVGVVCVVCVVCVCVPSLRQLEFVSDGTNMSSPESV